MSKTLTVEVECSELHCEDQTERTCPIFEEMPYFEPVQTSDATGADRALAEALRDLGMRVEVAYRGGDTTTLCIDNEDARRLLPIVRAAR